MLRRTRPWARSLSSDSEGSLVGKLLDEVRALRREVADLRTPVRQASRLQFTEEMTYTDAISYFVKHQPSEFSRAAMIREPYRGAHGSFVFTQVFLDDHDGTVRDRRNRIIGRQLLVGRLDPELDEVFGDIDLVIVE